MVTISRTVIGRLESYQIMEFICAIQDRTSNINIESKFYVRSKSYIHKFFKVSNIQRFNVSMFYICHERISASLDHL